MIMPNIQMRNSLTFRNINETGNSGLLKIIVIDSLKPCPLIVSTLKVPVSELEFI